MDLAAFKKGLARHLHPVLRGEGFKGSGATLRRVAGPLVHVFNVQGSQGGARCYLNLGVQLDFLLPGAVRPLEQVLEYECEFRERTDPPDARALGWGFGDSPEEADANARAVVAQWEAQGRSFFARFGRWPDDFATLARNFDLERGHPAAGRSMARIASRLGDPVRARAIAEAALRNAPQGASGLRHDLRQLLAGLPARAS